LQDIYAFVGQRIRAERKSRKLTLEELASAVGMNTSFLHQIETAKKKPSLNKIQQIAEALRIPVAQLFEGAKASKPADPFIGKLSVLVKDADSPRRRTILKVVKELAKDRG
jgi:transcriptional regulator with XRE-family HTH domain